MSRRFERMAVVTLSIEGAKVARAIAGRFPHAQLYVHADAASELPEAAAFDRVVELTERIFNEFQGIVFVMPTGVAVRAVAPCIVHKTTDPAVVVVDVLGRWAISLLSGHEGGANELAIDVANALDAEPIITTTTEAVKDLIVGVGCRRNTAADTIEGAVREALDMARASLARVRLLASVAIKSDEPGLLEAAERLGLPLRFIAVEEIAHAPISVSPSEFVQTTLGIPGVAEPVALLAGRRTKLLLPRTILNGVTVAIAREHCTWSGSGPADPSIAPPQRSMRSCDRPSSSDTGATSN